MNILLRAIASRQSAITRHVGTALANVWHETQTLLNDITQYDADHDWLSDVESTRDWFVDFLTRQLHG